MRNPDYAPPPRTYSRAIADKYTREGLVEDRGSQGACDHVFPCAGCGCEVRPLLQEQHMRRAIRCLACRCARFAPLPFTADRPGLAPSLSDVLPKTFAVPFELTRTS